MQSDSKHINPEPGAGCHNVVKNRHHRKRLSIRRPGSACRQAGMKYKRVPKDNHQSAVLFRIPSPESPPGLIRPDPPQNRSHKTEKETKTNHAIDHPFNLGGRAVVPTAVKGASENIEHSQESR